MALTGPSRRLSLFRTLVVTPLAMALLSASPAATAAAEQKIIATYGRAITKDAPPPGWSFLWNVRGDVCNIADCDPLERVEARVGDVLLGPGEVADRPAHFRNTAMFGY